MSHSNSKMYNFHVHGMHCHACTLLIESELSNLPGVVHARVDLHKKSLEISGDFGDKTPEEIADFLTVPIKDSGYTLSLEGVLVEKRWSEFKIAVPIALGFIILFLLLQKVGIINLVGGSNVTLGTAFVVGIIASLSTCMAVVGGLLLSMSATFAKEGEKVKPQILFHVGRLVSFFILGGVIGAIGSAFTLSPTATFILSVIIGFVMLILGINLLDVFHWSKKLQPSIPKFIGRYVHGVSKMNHTFTPFFVGVATFFMPCGFTQSMQVYTLSTGNFIGGAMTMFTFALGTLPVLVLISLSSFSIKNSPKAGVFFKSVGLIVILFALFNIINGLVVSGFLPPLFNF